uniref:WSC domain-containing protein n=1 Tax=Macrostomum lignano TaxID=282301 RepID=A0A1I8H6Q0_9PLAT
MFDQLRLGLCAECCYNAAYSYMSLLAGDTCYCGNELPGNDSLKQKNSACGVRCPGDAKEICGGERALSVYLVRSLDPKPLFIPFSPALDSLRVGPYCFYRAAGGRLGATYCNVPYCPISSSFDCLSSSNDGSISDSQYLRYTGHRSKTKTRDNCLNWSDLETTFLGQWNSFKLSFRLLSYDVRMIEIKKMYVETPDYSLYTNKTGNFCRAARVVIDAFVYKTGRSDGYYFIRHQIVKSDTPVCFVMINQRSAILGACRVDACSRVTQSIPGLVRDQVGNALLASRFGSSIGIGFTGCSFGNQACTMEDFTTLLHPELGLCHRFNQEKFVGLTKDLKATESLLSFNYFTDSTDSKGRRLPGLSRMA